MSFCFVNLDFISWIIFFDSILFILFVVINNWFIIINNVDFIFCVVEVVIFWEFGFGGNLLKREKERVLWKCIEIVFFGLRNMRELYW